MKITVKITKEILRESMYCTKENGNHIVAFIQKRSLGFNCAIGKAIGKLFPDALVGEFEIAFYKDEHHFAKGNYYLSIELPGIASEFIYEFDRMTPEERLNINPFSFEIDVPEELIQRIGIQEVETILSKSETLELVKS